MWWNGCGQNKQSERIKAGDADGKIVILSVPDTKEDILKKILKVVEGSADVEEWRMPSEKIERGDLQILLPEKMVYGLKNRSMSQFGQKKLWIMKMQLCGVLVSFGRN